MNSLDHFLPNIPIDVTSKAVWGELKVMITLYLIILLKSRDNLSQSDSN